MARTRTAYDRLIELLDTNDVDFRTIDHRRETATDELCSMLGCRPGAFARSIVVMVKISKHEKLYVLAVLPADRQIDFRAIKESKSAGYAGFAHPDIARRLSGCTAGSEVPFAWTPELELVVDPALYEHDEIYFAAGRLDRSVAMASIDHRRLAHAAEYSVSRR